MKKAQNSFECSKSSWAMTLFVTGVIIISIRWMGSAATVEQFIACFEAISGQDLSQFMRWYEQAGTPTLNVKRAGTKIEFEQILPATPGQNKKPRRSFPLNGRSSEMTARSVSRR